MRAKSGAAATDALKQTKPREEAARGNAWYVDDQFALQMGTPGRRSLIEARWSLFGEEVRRWAENGPPSGVLRVLDAGCGDGINLIGLARVADELGLKVDLFGTDYNSVRTSRSTGLARGICGASLLALPFADETFDIILCNHVLEHIPEDVAAMRELRRVLRRDGLLLVGVPNEGCALARLRNHVLQRSILSTTDHIHFHTEQSLTARLAEAGLDVRRVRREGFFVPHLRATGFLVERPWGRRLMRAAAAMAPGQAAGLIAVAVRGG